MPRPLHFHLPADDPARCIKFYSEVFGWKFNKWEVPEGLPPMDFWMVTTGPDKEPGINGGMMKREGAACEGLGRGVDLTLAVDALDDYVQKVLAAGGAVPEPSMLIPGVGKFAGCLDTEGNPFGMLQLDHPLR
jgi:hypothetical protein